MEQQGTLSMAKSKKMIEIFFIVFAVTLSIGCIIKANTAMSNCW